MLLNTTAAFGLVEPARSRRLARVMVSPELVAEMLRDGWETHHVRVVGGVPADAVLTEAFYDQRSRAFVLVFSHDSFAECREGERISELQPSYESQTCPTWGK